MSLFADSPASSSSGQNSEAVKRFVEYIKLQTYEDKYLDRKEERKILEKAVEMGLGIDEGLGIIRQVATANNIVLEREAEERAIDALRTFAMDGKVDKKEFANAITIFRTACKDKLPEIEIKRRLKKFMLENGWKAKEGGLFGSNWFSEIV
jgi:hypothetical protein